MNYTSHCSKCGNELSCPKIIRNKQKPVCIECKTKYRREYSRKRIGVKNPKIKDDNKKQIIKSDKDIKKSLTKKDFIPYEEWIKTLDQKKLIDWIESVKIKRIARGLSELYTG